MWINSQVDLPEELIGAQGEGRLVVFAGAGVSMGPPSNLPDFAHLVGMVGQDALARQSGEPPDHYLGRLQGQRVDVQALTRRIIDSPASQPRQLHRDLVSLFSSYDTLRVVTTNFDRHFTTTASEKFGSAIDTYCAPALPLGGDFAGIVYLHGSVDRLRSPLVLTDQDFGRAYVTEGWASRMLVEMFERYTVLFVGYSHDDPIMRYLARGLAPGTSRYALTTPGGSERWVHLGITPIEYPLRDDSNGHGALDDAIRAWATTSAMGALDHEVRVREIVQGTPPLDRETADYVAATLRDPVRLRFFAAHAQKPEWLRWVDDHEDLDILFVRNTADGGLTHTFALWFADQFVVQYPAQSIALVRKHGLTMCRELWTLIAWRLATVAPPPPADVLAAWAVALLQAAIPEWSPMFLGRLLAISCRPEDTATAALLFAALTRPRLVLRRQMSLGGDDQQRVQLEGEIDLVGDAHDIREGWRTIVRPRLDDAGAMFESVVTSHIGEAHQLLCAAGLANAEWDPASFRRSAIAPNADNLHAGAFDTLIDVARDFVEWILTRGPQTEDSLLLRWAEVDVPLLRRLALYGMAKSQRIAADDALALLAARGWLFSLPLKAEVFALLARAYPKASAAAREKLIAGSMRDPGARAVSGSDARTVSDYERYNLAVWLARVDPECSLAARHLAELQAAHPEFGPREHPGLTHWTSGARWGPGPSPLSVAELLSADPASLVDYLINYHGDDRSLESPTREGLLEDVGEACRRSFDWGWRLADALVSDSRPANDLWQAIIGAWGDAPLGDDGDARVLAFLRTHPAIEKAASGVVTQFIDRRIDNMPSGALTTAEEVADSLMVVAQGEQSDGTAQLTNGQWLTVAINHPAGRVAQVWIRALARWRADAGDGWVGIPSEYRRRFEGAIADAGHWAVMVRIVLASVAGYLFAIDKEWSRRYLIPLFNWDLDLLRAEQAWHGFAIWGQLSEPLLADLLPFLRQSFARLDAELHQVRTDLSERLVAVALYSSVDPVTSGWLGEFVRDGGEIARTVWAAGMARELRSLTPAAAQVAWDRWIATYWDRRLVGVPRPLMPGEGAEMVHWVFGLRNVAAAVTEKLCRSPVSVPDGRLVFHDLAEGDLAEAEPSALALILDHLLTSAGVLAYECGTVDGLVRRLVAASAPRATLRRICESLARLGCPSAGELARLIRGSEPE